MALIFRQSWYLMASSCHLLNSVPTIWQWAIKALPKSVHKHQCTDTSCSITCSKTAYTAAWQIHIFTMKKVLMLKLEVYQILQSTRSHSNTTVTYGHFSHSEFLEAEHRILLFLVEKERAKAKCMFSSKHQIKKKVNFLFINIFFHRHSVITGTN